MTTEPLHEIIEQLNETINAKQEEKEELEVQGQAVDDVNDKIDEVIAAALANDETIMERLLKYAIF